MASAGEIPDKLYFRIGEASRLVGVKPYVLRYWEKEFDVIRPEKHSGQRLYRRRDIELFREIRRCLHNERYTIEGTRKKLKKRQADKLAEPSARECLAGLKTELLNLRELLRQQYIKD
jgi:DNA-binding transcriptional MerR regulator